MNNKVMISTIIAAYNADKYIAETIESVIGQSFGFEENMELILVDDGSTDNTREVCEKYAEKYENIRYFYKENGGVAETKNYGLKFTNGKYVNFLDSDDILSKDALKNMYNFIEKNEDKIDMVAMPVVYFEKKNGIHDRYLRFNNQTCIVDLRKDPQGYVFSTVAMLYKRSLFNTVKFNTKLKIAEDLYLNTKLFIKNPKYGMMSADEATYFYRKRHANDSITSENEYKEEWLIDVLLYLKKGIEEYCAKYTDKTPDFVKYILIYNIVKRLKTPNYVDKKKLNRFYEVSKEILSGIEDDIISSYQYDDYYFLAMMFMMKYDIYDIKELISIDKKNNVVIKNKIIENIETYSIQISNIKVNEDKLLVQGYFNDIITDDYKICYKKNKEVFDTQVEETDNIFLQKRFFDKVISHTYQVKFELPFAAGGYSLILKNGDRETILQLKNIYGDESILVNKEYTINKKKYNVKINSKKIYIKESEN